jgi:hypothetical protein
MSTSNLKPEQKTNAYLATGPLILADGDLASQDLSLFSVATGRIAGSIQMCQGNGVEGVLLSYQIAGQPLVTVG